MKFQILLIATLLLFTGCVQQPVAEKAKVVKKKTNTTKQTYVAPPPKKEIKLKEVEDENFSSEYMYPETKKKTAEVKKVESASVTAPVSSTMSKDECVTMIGQEKFDKYAQMYGGESASLKKCKMLKAL